MKILDRYILTSYLKTFFSVFAILMLIFVLQAIWLYIKELAGKDLDIVTIGKFLIYVSPKLIPLVLPLTILLSSIMVFGSFAESYEFAAMKSSGISLQRAMRSLSIFIIGLGVITFIFANNVIPRSEYNFYNLRKNIAKLKPTMAIAEGQFNQIGEDINIKVDRKSGERDNILEGITMHKKGSNGKTNSITIRSKTGEIKSSEDSEDFLQLVLYDGYYYDDTPPKKPKERKKRPFVKSYFKKYTINYDLSGLNNIDLDEKNVDSRHTMLNINELAYTVDSLSQGVNLDYIEFSESLYNRSGIKTLNSGIKDIKEEDSIYTGKVLDLFKTDRAKRIIEMAMNTISSSGQIIRTKDSNLKVKRVTINHHLLVLHEKLAIGFACIILFFVGAPLGALIRKGGIGLPLVIAILLFLTYHFIGIFAKNSAKDGTIDPSLAPWIATIIMFPLGVYLTKRATADRGLFEIDSLIEPIKKLFKIKSSADSKINPQDFKGYNDDKLLDIIKDPRKSNHTEDSKYYAISTLIDRGHTIEKLKGNGVTINNHFNQDLELRNSHKDYSKYSLVFYLSGLVLLILYFIFRNNKLPSLASMSLQLSIVSFTVLTIYYIAVHINLKKMERSVPNKLKSSNLIVKLLGLALYPITHFLQKAKIENYLRQKCLISLK